MCSQHAEDHRNSGVRDDKLNAAAMPGAGALSLLNPRPGERILDLGCGIGNLTAAIAATGAIPTGIDKSEEMVGRARRKFPELNIQTGDVCYYRTDSYYDAVFSNAVIHWIKDAPAAARSIWLALRDGGRFVAEFAGSGNVSVLTTAMEQELEAHGYAWAGRNPWYFPTIGEYTTLLEQTGFRVTFAQHFDTLTPIKGENGIRKWLESFSEYFFQDVTTADKTSIFRSIEAKVEPHLNLEGQWMADTSRLRIEAMKKPARIPHE
ncbi:class I SAM-dependent methyltransferase [Paenibacillus nasutitermitis]|uniref:SAM-dependent methyltransferase n=1 Tax=Paenibacillus nasutitermitis TaxID=1652958 RepID=A0A916YTU9_9BACL|nr:methyltransferase domain-containing protein [Paenibacillus nasutitermitis]GGD60257.1 SAM-dependent methyltransferase [Paenibacillus nasutitermitis]